MWAYFLIDDNKAYNCVDHTILIAKLENARITSLLPHAQSFISNHRFKVSLIGNFSEISDPLDMSVLQGSILGVILFLDYFHDFPDSIGVKNKLFADNSSLKMKV